MDYLTNDRRPSAKSITTFDNFSILPFQRRKLQPAMGSRRTVTSRSSSRCTFRRSRCPPPSQPTNSGDPAGAGAGESAGGGPENAEKTVDKGEGDERGGGPENAEKSVDTSSTGAVGTKPTEDVQGTDDGAGGTEPTEDQQGKDEQKKDEGRKNGESSKEDKGEGHGTNGGGDKDDDDNDGKKNEKKKKRKSHDRDRSDKKEKSDRERHHEKSKKSSKWSNVQIAPHVKAAMEKKRQLEQQAGKGTTAGEPPQKIAKVQLQKLKNGSGSVRSK